MSTFSAFGIIPYINMIKKCFFIFPSVCYDVLSHVQLCNPLDCSAPGSSVHGIFQLRIPEWVTVSSSRASFWPRDQIHISCISCIAGGYFPPIEPLGKPHFPLYPSPILSFLQSLKSRDHVCLVAHFKASELSLICLSFKCFPY